jgi:hypothetical protein
MNPRKRILDPQDRFSEILFGLIMVLGFTCTLSVTGTGRDEVRAMLVAALGCNLAWGIVDAVMYMIAAVTERARGRLLLRRLHTEDPAGGQRLIAGTLPDKVAAVLGPDDLEAMRVRLLEIPVPPERIGVTPHDFVAGLAVFLLVALSTLPVTVPFMIFEDTLRAMRWSNGVALVMLFVLGFRVGRYSGGRPWRLGIVMALLGCVMVAVTIALGG